jgi:Pentapeptide repeats (8 copies)
MAFRLAASLLLMLTAPLAHAADGAWTWKDAQGHTRTEADLESLLIAHAHWLATGVGAPLDLSEANLDNANLQGKDLSRAELEGTNLRWANLIGANLSHANLGGADLYWANLSMADLSWANLGLANLSGAHIGGADLSEAGLFDARFFQVRFQPRKNPNPEQLAAAVGLDELTWDNDSGPIYAMRKALSDAGFRAAARRLTAAIHRHDQSSIEKWLFDWTCEWGADYLRPLLLEGVLCLICTPVYWIGMHFARRSGLYLAATGQPIKTDKARERVVRLSPRSAPLPRVNPQLELAFDGQQPSPHRLPIIRRAQRFVRRELRALGTAFLFSLMSVFNIGFREFNFGRWIRMLQPREFDIRARGWMRTVSGVQSLLGVALTTLALLSYFGHPFD